MCAPTRSKLTPLHCGLQKCNPQGGRAISLDEWITHVLMDSRKCPNSKVIVEHAVFGLQKCNPQGGRAMLLDEIMALGLIEVSI